MYQEAQDLLKGWSSASAGGESSESDGASSDGGGSSESGGTSASSDASGSESSGNAAHTVIFRNWDGSEHSTQTVAEGGKASAPATAPTRAYILAAGLYRNPVPANYSFAGWSADPNGGTGWDFDTTVSSGITLYARWTVPGLVPYGDAPANSVYAAILTVNGSAPEAYTLVMDEDAPAIAQTPLSGANLTIRGLGAERTIDLDTTATAPLFTISGGASLTLGENITLRGISGGAFPLVLVNGGDLVMEAGSKITGHTTSTQGGAGVSVQGGTFTMKAGSKVTGHTTASQGGAGVFVQGGTFNMHGGEVSGNSATSGGSLGGGVHVAVGLFSMSGGVISGNNAAKGGGVYVAASGNFTMSGDAAVSGNNTASDSGGGVWAAGSFTMSGDAAVSGNTTTGQGGGVAVEGNTSEFTMSGGEVSGNNTTGSGGGVHVSGGGTFDMTAGVVSDNTATDNGGGVRVFGATCTFTMSAGAAVSGNTTAGANGGGGGVCVESGSTFTMNGGSVSRNRTTAINSNGGGVYVVDANSTFNMHGGVVSGNTTVGGGGGVGVHSSGSIFKISDGTVHGVDESVEPLRNGSGNSTAALYKMDNNAVTQYGSFANNAWDTSMVPLTSTNNTIHVANGVLQGGP